MKPSTANRHQQQQEAATAAATAAAAPVQKLWRRGPEELRHGEHHAHEAEHEAPHGGPVFNIIRRPMSFATGGS